MICYVVIDTNVLISALLSEYDDAATVQVVRRMIEGKIIPVYSQKIMKEYQEVLSRKKFGFPQDIVDYLLLAIAEYGVFIEPIPTDAVLPDMKDLPFYEVVLEKRDEGTYLVTENVKHFPKKNFIVTARQMIDILDNMDKE